MNSNQWGHVDEHQQTEPFEQWVKAQFDGTPIIMMSNREPVRHDRDQHGSVRPVRCAGGLVSAIEPIVSACRGVWVAHGCGSGDRLVVDARDSVLLPEGEDRYRLRRVWLTPDEERRYYDGFANEGLWPLCHTAHVAPIFRAADFNGYSDVNARFAAVACEEAGDSDPLIVVHDYHLALAPRVIRMRREAATVAAFWHIPWPHPQTFAICPWRERVIEGLLGSTLLGFQTTDDRDNFLASAARFTRCTVDPARSVVSHALGHTTVRVYPVSVECPSRWAVTAAGVSESRHRVRSELGLPPDTIVGVGVDRLDYTKGIEQKFAAIGALLDRRPALRGRLVFVQVAEPSREHLRTYRDLRSRVANAAARVNSQFGTPGYQPIVLRQTRHEPLEVFELFRAADFCYVASLHDGMNLVAKEFAVARSDERGVLILSEFTGAARELFSALVVNPYALGEVAAAIERAIAMSGREQAQRMRAMRSVVARANVRHWMQRILTDAQRLGRNEGTDSDSRAPANRVARLRTSGQSLPAQPETSGTLGRSGTRHQTIAAISCFEAHDRQCTAAVRRDKIAPCSSRSGSNGSRLDARSSSGSD